MAHVLRPAWRDLPASGISAGAGYANLTRPAPPNVLLVLRAPMPLQILGGPTRPVTRVGLHLDAPDAFVAALAPATAAAPGETSAGAAPRP